ncbi:MAG: preprotein translocase subunit YajC [Clostridia bacterium]|nr:preprotein translocase subunit YajC [Clostridia bacterium]
MLNMLCATKGIGWTIALIALLALMVVYLVFGTINRKKNQEQVVKMINELKKGDKVVTNAGVYGEIASIRETNMGKVVVIKTGHEEDSKNASFITVNASVILGLDKKEDLIFDKDGNVVEPIDLKKEVMAEISEKTENKSKEKSAEKTQVKPAKKTTAKKPVAKKPATAKKETK